MRPQGRFYNPNVRLKVIAPREDTILQPYDLRTTYNSPLAAPQPTVQRTTHGTRTHRNHTYLLLPED